MKIKSLWIIMSPLPILISSGIITFSFVSRLSRKYFIPSFSLFLDSIISGTKILLPTTNAISLVKI